METTASWNAYAGSSIENWRLDSFLGMKGRCACFMARDSEGAEPLLIQLIPGDGDDPVRSSWQRAQPLSHQHLMQVRATGEAELCGNRVAYAVMDLPDDDLEDILARGPLGSGDAAQLRLAILGALDDLHQRGLRHGALAPAEILFVRGTPKLSVDSIVPADEDGQADDFRQFESVLPVPKAPGWSPRIWQPAAIVLGGVLAITTIYLLLHRQMQPPQPLHAAVAIKRNPAVAVKHEPAASPETPAPSLPDLRTSVPARRPKWAVIAATYGNFDGAEKRAAQLRKHTRGLQPHVFPQAGEGRLYFVVLGSGMTQDAAERLRRHAVALGAPRDTYVTKLDES